MEILEMVWTLVVVMVGLVAADFFLIRRSTNRMVNVLMRRPLLKSFNDLLLSPEFDKFMAETIESIKIFNKQVRKIEKEGLGCLLK